MTSDRNSMQCVASYIKDSSKFVMFNANPPDGDTTAVEPDRNIEVSESNTTPSQTLVKAKAMEALVKAKALPGQSLCYLSRL